MMNEHLSEAQLQLFALEQSSDVEMKHHVESCISCQEQIAAYRLLMTGIHNQPAAAFDFDLADVVLQRLQPIKTKKAKGNIRPFIIAAFVAVPLYLFRDNFLHLANGISLTFLLISLLACVGIIVFKAINIYRTYERQIEKLKFSE